MMQLDEGHSAHGRHRLTASRPDQPMAGRPPSPENSASLKPFDALGMTVTGGTVPTVRFRISVK